MAVLIRSVSCASEPLTLTVPEQRMEAIPFGTAPTYLVRDKDAKSIVARERRLASTSSPTAAMRRREQSVIAHSYLVM